MQIKKFTDFGLRMLMLLAAQPEGASTTIKDMGRLLNLSPNHLNKVVHDMAKQGWIVTKRGRSGGFSLACKPKELRVDQLIRSMEADEPWVNCHNPECQLYPGCHLHQLIAEGKALFYQHLAKFTLADLVKDKSVLASLGKDTILLDSLH
ncbi:transcriptional regulator [Idiomarina tyrosinivorans]|uniref:Transcriptional regulator n=1 Tax=Idiomarina tyrosinivorans TaxID=1445662 RepID=A0A432ZG00_9GAMM|nr:Rrf2 family transcriptional regulator [Idiomarina tyrosinivorans]RUO76905.1 transcriptional regulator [Idiomarina tyrosinivorans]